MTAELANFLVDFSRRRERDAPRKPDFELGKTFDWYFCRSDSRFRKLESGEVGMSMESLKRINPNNRFVAHHEHDHFLTVFSADSVLLRF